MSRVNDIFNALTLLEGAYRLVEQWGITRAELAALHDRFQGRTKAEKVGILEREADDFDARLDKFEARVRADLEAGTGQDEILREIFAKLIAEAPDEESDGQEESQGNNPES